MRGTHSETMTDAMTPEDAADLLRALEPDDEIEVGGDTWRVLESHENSRGVPFVRCKARTGYHPGSTTFKPSSGYQNSVVTTHSRGMGSHYGRISVEAGN